MLVSEFMIVAANRCDLPYAKKLLLAGAPVDALGSEGLTPLILATENSCDFQFIQALMEYGANPNLCTYSGMFALHYAASDPDSNVLELLLNSGASPDVQTLLGYTPLMMAATSGAVGSISRLIEAGADINFESHTRACAVDLAAENGHPKATSLLLESGALADAASSSVNPLAVRILGKRRYVQTLSIFVQYGVLCLDTIEYLSSFVDNQEVRDLLHVYGQAGYGIADNPTITTVGESELNNLMRMVIHDSPGIDQWISQNRLELNEQSLTFRKTPLMFAALRNRIAIARKLVQAGASVSAQDINGETVIMQAIKYGSRSELLIVLMESLQTHEIPSLNFVDRTGKTAMIYACQRQNAQAMYLLSTKNPSAYSESKWPCFSPMSPVIPKLASLYAHYLFK